MAVMSCGAHAAISGSVPHPPDDWTQQQCAARPHARTSTVMQLIRHPLSRIGDNLAGRRARTSWAFYAIVALACASIVALHLTFTVLLGGVPHRSALPRHHNSSWVADLRGSEHRG